jgi:hypothetical protein
MNAISTDVAIFDEVRKWMYCTSEKAEVVVNALSTSEIYKSRAGLHVMMKYYVCAHKLDCEWLQDLLIDFIMAGFFNMGPHNGGGGMPNLREIEFVYTHTHEHAYLRNYMALAFQYTIIAADPEKGPTNQEIHDFLIKNPEIQADFLIKSRGIMNRKVGTISIPMLAEYKACVFHIHPSDETCYAEGKEIFRMALGVPLASKPRTKRIAIHKHTQVATRNVAHIPVGQDPLPQVPPVQAPAASAASACPVIVHPNSQVSTTFTSSTGLTVSTACEVSFTTLPEL